METKVAIAVGSGVQSDLDGFDGNVLLIDTTPTVDEKRTPRVNTYRLTRQPRRELPGDIPPSHVSEHGDGCGLNSANGYAAARSSDGLKRAIENHIGDANLVFVNVSPNGGTGNGSWPVIEETFTEMSPENKRVYWIHHLALVNRHKLYTRLSDLRRKLSVGIHVLVKRLETARSILGLRPHESDAIEEVVKNIKATRGGGSFEMIITLDVDEENFIEDVTSDILLHAADLWNRGLRDLDAQEVERTRHTVRNSLHEYQRLSDESLGRISALLGGCQSEADVARVGELQIRARHLAVLGEADQSLSRISNCVLECGLERVADILREAETRLETQHEELSRAQASLSGHDLMRDYVISQRSWVNRFIHKLGLNGKAEKGLAGYLTREFRRAVKRDLSSGLGGLLERFPTATGSGRPKYRLPADSDIKRDLAELFLRQPDSATGRQAVRSEIKNKLREIMLESTPISTREDLSYDFGIGQDIMDTQGLVVYSKHDLGSLPDLLHINLGHSRFHRSDQFLRMIAFVVVKDLMHIPELAQIVRREQSRNPLDPDVMKDRVRSIRELIIPPFVFTHDEKTEAGLVMLAQCYFTPDRLEVFKRGYVVATMKSRRVRYNSLDELIAQLTDEDRLHIHDSFWNFVSLDPRKVLTEIENVVLGRVTGESAERLKAIREFSGRTRWDTSVSALVEAVRAAVIGYNKT